MTTEQTRAQQVQHWIADTLRRNWDPIGVGNEPGAQDEYDAYVAGVYRLIVAGVSARQLADHLAQIETEQLGFQDTDPKMLVPLAEKLLRLNVGLKSSDGAV